MSGGCYADTDTGRILARKVRVTVQMGSVNIQSSLYHLFSQFSLTSNSARLGEEKNKSGSRPMRKIGTVEVMAQ